MAEGETWGTGWTEPEVGEIRAVGGPVYRSPTVHDGPHRPMVWFKLRSWVGVGSGGAIVPSSASTWHIVLRNWETEHLLAHNVLDGLRIGVRVVVVGKVGEPRHWTDGGGNDRIDYRMTAYDVAVSMRSRLVTVGKANRRRHELGQPTARARADGAERTLTALDALEAKLARLSEGLEVDGAPALDLRALGLGPDPGPLE